MLRKLLSRRPSHGTAVAYLALFVALGGGAYAATQLPPNSVGTPQLKPGAVTSGKIKDGTIVGADLNKPKLGTVPSAVQAGNAAKLGGLPPSSYPAGPRAYAHVHEGTLVASDTKGVLDMSIGCGGGAQAPACDPVSNPQPALLCFSLSFTPRIIEVTPERKFANSGGGSSEASHWAALAPAVAPAISYSGCPSDHRAAMVLAVDANDMAPVKGVYITFY
jgi:hypothetical protein